MRNKGWIKLWRQFANSALWMAEPFTRAQAWLDLQMMACYLEEGNQHPGDVFCSIRYLAQRWQWSREKVSRFLQWMAQQQWITLYPNQPEDQSGHRPLLRLVLYGFDQLGQPLSLPDIQPEENPDRPQNRPPFRPASALDSTGPASSDQPANRPPFRPAGHPDRPQNRPLNRPPFRPVSALDSPGLAGSDQPANRPPFRPENRHIEEEYRSILCRGVKAPGIEEKEVPPEYRDRFPTWEEYAAWRYQ